jgi:hypothetical protein
MVKRKTTTHSAFVAEGAKWSDWLSGFNAVSADSVVDTET